MSELANQALRHAAKLEAQEQAQRDTEHANTKAAQKVYREAMTGKSVNLPPGGGGVDTLDKYRREEALGTTQKELAKVLQEQSQTGTPSAPHEMPPSHQSVQHVSQPETTFLDRVAEIGNNLMYSLRSLFKQN